MSTANDALDQIFHLSTTAGEVAIKLAGAGAKELCALLYAGYKTLKSRHIPSGMKKHTALLLKCKEEGSAILRCHIKKSDLDDLQTYAKETKFVYSAPHLSESAESTVLFSSRDVALINEFLEIKGYARVSPEQEGIAVTEPTPEEIEQVKKNGRDPSAQTLPTPEHGLTSREPPDLPNREDAFPFFADTSENTPEAPEPFSFFAEPFDSIPGAEVLRGEVLTINARSAAPTKSVRADLARIASGLSRNKGKGPRAKAPKLHR
ncbi:hypothetical protein LJC32_02995 [Oscillospiraceae bacterium OttesenSCG-928-F05]|nr:hypothetical protein [Oscillospiraceae bacterium OttesenSCG-928-F05]